MKNKIIFGLLLTAIATFSFTAISIKQSNINSSTEVKTVKKSQTEPIGGFLSEDRF